jgi:hypothetical protein
MAPDSYLTMNQSRLHPHHSGQGEQPAEVNLGFIRQIRRHPFLPRWLVLPDPQTRDVLGRRRRIPPVVPVVLQHQLIIFLPQGHVTD